MSNKVPKIRFNGYSDAWVQRNLGEVVQKVKSYSLSRDVETEDDTGFEYIHYGDIHTQKADVIDGNTKLPSIVPGDYDLIQEGDVIVADASEDYLGIAEPAVVVNKPTENLVAGLHTIAIRPNGIHPLFLYYLLHTQLFKHFGYRTGTGLKVFGISYPNLAKFTFAMPTLDEQKAIANTLRDMDNLIAANQRKLDLLKEQKKGYLQKMFPKNGEKVPELRFAGFADDWEERKLGQYTKLITKGTTPKNKTGIGDVNFVKVENITNGKIYPINKIKQNEHDNYLKRSRLEEKDILFSIAGTLGRTAIVNKSILPANTNQALAIIRGYDFDTNFLITSLAGNVVKEYIRRNPTVGAQPNLSLEQVGNLLVNTPNDEEQQKIGSFFKQLDDTIALHQRKLDLLKEQKKGFLQNMFV
ncbi:restriction endonuclease subunit S [Weissella cibaria]|uniref:restriction endonuclease subunit S n=1 Tax=Weissella cibaria TaxID=137591 RepID=UPI0015F59FA3|nr:restriction endonuclease subunit S [Weissella cibaria]MBA5963498.1 restriction endonuclease subunit S [Weissella cibaria]